MATPPKPDPLSQRRQQNVDDDFYDGPICPCEDEEPEPQSEYDVAGEWITYTGDVDMSIFDRAAWSAKDEIDREIRAFTRNEQLELRSALSSSSESSSDQNTPSTNPISDHPYFRFAPSAPSLDELSLDDSLESELVLIREENPQSDAEAGPSQGPHAYWCDNNHHRSPQASGSRVMTRINIREIRKDEVPKQTNNEAVVEKAEGGIVEAAEWPAETAEASDEAENQAVVVIPSDQVETQD